MSNLCCDICGDPSGYSLVCMDCIKYLKPSKKKELTIKWHNLIVPYEEGGECFHCELWFPRNELAGDHYPITKGARPDLRYDLRNGVPTCAFCNTSGAFTRKKPTPEMLAVFNQVEETK